MRAWILSTAVGLACITFGAPLGAQVSPVGPEFQVNTYADGVQHESAVDFDAAGNFVVVWNDEYHSFRGYDLDRVRGRRYPPDGQPAGPEFLVQWFEISQAPGLVVQDGGDFVVVRSEGEYCCDPDSTDIQAKLLDPQGVPTGYFQVNSITAYYQLSSNVASTPGAGFAIVWESYVSGGNDNSGKSIQARQFTADGTPLSADFQVNSYVTGWQQKPQIAVNSTGDFIVVWQTAGPVDGDASGLGIRARRFDTAGLPLSDEFQVNEFTSDEQSMPVVATLADGGFVIAWQSAGSSGGDSSDLSVQARIYSPSGAPLATQFQVNSYSTGAQKAPAVAADSNGTFAIAWTSEGSSATDNSATSVQVRRYRADGSVLTEEFQANSYTTNRQELPAISFAPDGDFVVTWESFGSTGGDASASSIQARQFHGLFADGFESGTIQRWSLAVE